MGRINKIKNLEFTINSLKILKDKGFLFKMLVLGSGQDENYFANLVKKLGLQNEVIFVGKVCDSKLKSAYYLASDLHLFASCYDTDGIVKIEAAAFGLPTLLVENAIAASNCTNNVNAFVCKMNENVFANKIVEIFEDEKTLKKVKLGCKKDLFVSWDDIVKKVLQTYKNLEKNKIRSTK